MCTLNKKEPVRVNKGDVVRIIPVGSIRPVGSYHVVVNAKGKSAVYTQKIVNGRADLEDSEYYLRKDNIAKIPVIHVIASDDVTNTLLYGAMPTNISYDYNRWEKILNKYQELDGECVFKFTNMRMKINIYISCQTAIGTAKSVVSKQTGIPYKKPFVTLVGVTRLS